MAIEFKEVSYTYSPGTPFQYNALENISLALEEGKITAVIGHTGSGKSTLVQHLNGLLLPTQGSVVVGEKTIVAGEKTKGLKELRRHVGLVFQFPEYQLFEETILKDVAFGPKNFQVSEEEANKKAKEALKLVGLDSSYYERSPLELSGGQKRRVAIAGILAMDPDVIILDEPTAGLDPKGAKDMMQLFMNLNKQYHKTIVIVTHDMEHVLNYCDRVVVIEKGKLKLHMKVKEFFKDSKLCLDMNILPPSVIQMRDALNIRGFSIAEDTYTIESLAKQLARQVKNRG